MRTTSKIAIGIGLAGSALLAAYFLTGNRKRKTQDFISKTGKKLKEVLDAKEKQSAFSHEVDYV
jgi:hypothetical protein